MQSREERLAAEVEVLRTTRNELMDEKTACIARLAEAARLLNTPFSDEEADIAAFGRGVWIYCSQHMRPHLTGWCSVGVYDKIGLGVQTSEDAYEKCRRWKLPLDGERKE